MIGFDGADVFEKFFSDFGKKIGDYVNLKRLNPSYRVYFPENEKLDIPADYEELKELFEELEEGAGEKLDQFISQAETKYNVGVKNLVYKPSLSVREFINKETISGALKLDIFNSMHKHIRKFFKNEKIIKLLEFPILFLGATPKNTPSLYSLMNYADIKLGTWYPEGGMHKIVEAMVSLAKEKGVKFYFSEEVKSFDYSEKTISNVITDKKTFDADYVVCSADYHHFDQNILKENIKKGGYFIGTCYDGQRIFSIPEKSIQMNLYEHVFILRQDISNTQVDEIMDNFEKVLTENKQIIWPTQK